jgi:hypothetical protein
MMANRDEKWRKEAFNNQKSTAKGRGIPFLLTFDQWWKIWEKSKKWEKRGFKKGQYVMARFGDKGPYAEDNVKIVTSEENHIEALIGNKFSLGCRPSSETRAKLSAAKIGNTNGITANSGKKFSEQHKARISASIVAWHRRRKGFSVINDLPDGERDGRE